jgi:hypothetical protein
MVFVEDICGLVDVLLMNPSVALRHETQRSLAYFDARFADTADMLQYDNLFLRRNRATPRSPCT